MDAETTDHPEKGQETPANQENYAPAAFDTATTWRKVAYVGWAPSRWRTY